MDMDTYKHRATTNNHKLYLYLLRMCDFRTAKFGRVVLFLFFFACGGLVGPRVTVTQRSWTALSCVLYYISLNFSGPTTVTSRTRDETSRRDETRREGPHERAIDS